MIFLSTVCFNMIMLYQAVAAHLDVSFHFRTKEAPAHCRSYVGCNLKWTTSLLRMNEIWETSVIFMQEGHVKAVDLARNRHFHESTVIPVRFNASKSDDILYLLRLQLYGLPDGAQENYFLDITQHMNGYTPGKLVEVETGDIRFRADVKELSVRSKVQQALRLPQVGCFCKNATCSCCEHMDIPKIDFNETGCVNVTYLPVEKGFKFDFVVNGVIIYEDKISVRNPPPVCFGIPGTKEFASVCVRITNIKEEDDVISGCVEVVAELYHVRVYEEDLGCFHIPLLA